MPTLKISDGIDLEEDLDGSIMRKLRELGTARVFTSGEYLYRQGDPAKHIFLLLSGCVKATSTHINGFDTLLKIHRPGSLLGLSALRHEGLRDANGIAIDEIETISFPQSVFLKILESNGELGVVLIRILLKRQQELHTRIRNFIGNSVEQRLAEALLQLQSESATRVENNRVTEISITHEDLASLVISRRQYVTQILQVFAEKKLIETGHKKLRVLNPNGLRQIIDGCVLRSH